MQNESARLFRALLQKQLREQGAFLRRSARTGKQRSMVGKILFGELYAVVVLTLMGSFGAMAWPLGELLLPRGLDAVYFLPMELLALLVGVLAGALSSYSSLFQAKDNDLLLAMPIPPWMIFVVRLLGLYSTALFYMMIAWVPTEIVYGLYAQKPAAGLWCALPMALLIAGAASVLSALIGWGAAFATAKPGGKRWPPSLFPWAGCSCARSAIKRQNRRWGYCSKRRFERKIYLHLSVFGWHLGARPAATAGCCWLYRRRFSCWRHYL